MPSHRYTRYVAQGQIAVLQRRLEARKIALIIVGQVLALAAVATPAAEPEVQWIGGVVMVGTALNMAWSTAAAWRLSRKIRRLREGLRA